MQNKLFHSTLATHCVEKTVQFKTKTNGDYCEQFPAFPWIKLMCLKEFSSISGTKQETKIRNDDGSCEEVV